MSFRLLIVTTMTLNETISWEATKAIAKAVPLRDGNDGLDESRSTGTATPVHHRRRSTIALTVSNTTMSLRTN